jgi:hypothetical protein
MQILEVKMQATHAETMWAGITYIFHILQFYKCVN